MSQDGTEDESWVVLHCPEDDSHVLVQPADVLCIGLPKKDEEIQFSYPGTKKLYFGTVKAISDDYGAMRKLMDNLNSSTKPRREPSERRVVKRGMERGLAGMGQASAAASKEKSETNGKEDLKRKHAASSGPCGSKKLKDPKNSIANQKSEKPCKTQDAGAASSNSGKGQVKKNVRGSFRQRNNSSSADEKEDDKESNGSGDAPNDDDESADDSGSELDEAQLALMKKLAKKNKDIDMLKLFSLSKDSKEDSKEVSKEVDKTAINSPAPVHSKEQPGYQDKKQQAKAASKKKRGKDRDVKEYLYDGEFFRHQAGDEKVEKVSQDIDGVYVTQADIRELKKRWHTPTAVARALARKIFTDEALQVCSVAGKVKVQGGLAERRTALNRYGVDAILDFVDKRCSKKNWRRPEDSTIRQAINNMLYEERSKQE